MKILVLGRKGQLGRCLHDQLGSSGHEVTYTSHEQIDITQFEFTKSKILEISPEVVINAVAYTAVDNAEEDQERADLVNHLAVAHIAKICQQLECWLIHLSTDYVFDGNAKIPYRENDKTNPQCVYGDTKLKGELAIQSSGCRHIIIRTAWVFSEYGNNFLKSMLRLGSERDELNIVADQVGCPTYAQDIARCIVDIIPQLRSRKDSDIFHYCGDQSSSWYEFANVIFNKAKINGLKIPSIVNSIETSAYPTPAKRPSFSVLNCSKIQNEFGVSASNWQNGTEQVVGKLKSENLVS